MTKLKLCIAIAGLVCAATAQRLHAQPSAVTVALKAYTQAPNVVNGATTKYSVNKTPFTTVSLLNLIANALGTNFPAGAKLVMVNYDSFRVEAADGEVLRNLETSLIDARYETYTYSGSYNSTTGRGTYQYSYILTIDFDDGGDNEFTLRGFVTENYSRSAEAANGSRIIRDSFLMTASGDGKLNGQDVVLNGKISGRGRLVEN